MNITFRYSEREFRLALNQSHGDFKRVIFDLALSVALIILGISLMLNSSFQFYSGIIITVSLLYLFVIGARYFIVPRLLFSREPKYKEEYSLSFLDENIQFAAGEMKSTIPWSHYKEVKESSDFVFLVYGKKRYTIIPKRVFEDLGELNAFKSLVLSKINKKR